MKILVISHAYVESANRKKIETLASVQGSEVAVIYPRTWKTWHGELKEQKADIEHRNSYKEFHLGTLFSGSSGKYLYNPIQLIISILNFKPDIIYLEEEPFNPVAFELSLASFMLRIKLAFFSWENLDINLGFWRNIIERFTFWVSAKAIAGNRQAKERLLKRGYSEAVEVIPQFGVDMEVFKRSFLNKEVPSKITIGFVGRPTLDKGIGLLVKALSRLPAEYRLLIVTSSQEIPTEIINLAGSEGVTDRVVYKVNIPHRQLPEFLNKMDVFVLPSQTTKTWKEQFGRTLIEAMACGVPVIGSSSGAIPEVVDDAGLIFKENDESDLLSKLNQLGNAELRQKYSEAGFDRIKNNYIYSIIGSKLTDFLER